MSDDLCPCGTSLYVSHSCEYTRALRSFDHHAAMARIREERHREEGKGAARLSALERVAEAAREALQALNPNREPKTMAWVESEVRAKKAQAILLNALAGLDAENA